MALGVTAGIFLLFLVITDWPLGLLSEFWAEHSMLTNVVSSMLFLLMGATIVEAWLSREDSRRFQVIQAAAFSSLSNAPITQRRALWFLVNGGHIQGNADFRITPDEAARLERIYQRHGLRAASEEDVRLGRMPIPDDVQRLRELATDREWLELAYEIILRSLYNSRLIIARWAHLLITSEEASYALQQMSIVILDMQELRKKILSILSIPTARDSNEAVALIRLWRKCFVNSCAAYGDLAQSGMSADLADWDTGMLLLQPADRELIVSKARRNGRRFPIGRVYTAEQMPAIEFSDEIPARLKNAIDSSSFE